MIYEKRGRWCFEDKDGRLRKFVTEAEAKAAYEGTISSALASLNDNFSETLKSLDDELEVEEDDDGFFEEVAR